MEFLFGFVTGISATLAVLGALGIYQKASEAVDEFHDPLPVITTAHDHVFRVGTTGRGFVRTEYCVYPGCDGTRIVKGSE